MVKIMVSRWESYFQVNSDTEKKKKETTAGLPAWDAIIDFSFLRKNILNHVSPEFYLFKWNQFLVMVIHF